MHRKPPESGTLVLVSPEAMTSLPTNKHQIARRLALRDWLILYVHGRPSPPGARSRGRWLIHDGGVYRLDPYGLPRRLERRSGMSLRTNMLLLRIQVRLALRVLGWGEPDAAIVYFPPAWKILKLAKRGVFHLVDHFPSFPEWASHAELMETSEVKACATADEVWVSAPALLERVSPWSRNAVLLPNVADVLLFGSKAGVPVRPRTMAFSGALSSHKIDFDLLHAAVEGLPAWRLDLYGPVTDAGAATAVEQLVQTGNVIHHGEVPQSALPKRLSEAEVLLMPYKINEHTTYVYPLKVYEYLATGRAVVSTPLPAIADLTPDVEFVHDADGLVRLLEARALSAPNARHTVSIDLLDHDWGRRIDEIERRLRVSETS